jgi:hypothetical protein
MARKDPDPVGSVIYWYHESAPVVNLSPGSGSLIHNYGSADLDQVDPEHQKEVQGMLFS